MKIAIIYCSKHGTTGKIAKLIAEKRSADDVDLVNLMDSDEPVVDQYDQIVIGGSIHYGRIQKNIKRFCERYTDKLIQKDLGLFICCMLDEKKEEQFENAFPEVLRQHSKAKGCFGGEFLIEKMNFLEKLIVKKVANATTSSSHINFDEVDHFIAQLGK